MTKYLASLALILTSAMPAADNANWGSYYTTTVNAVGASADFEANATNHTLQVVVVSPSTCTVRLEGSLDRKNWNDLSGSQPCTSSTMFHVGSKSMKYVRGYLITYGGDAGGAVVTLTYRGSR